MVASFPTDSLHNLPPSLTTLVGRTALLDALEALTRGGVRLITLTGPGGAGKTRLALELARRLAPHLPDGAWFVSLAAVSDPAHVPATVATTLGLREAGSIGPEALVAAWARERDTLPVLDNFEQILSVRRMNGIRQRAIGALRHTVETLNITLSGVLRPLR